MALRERLLSRALIDPETGCLLWTGARTSKGYGEIAISDGRRDGGRKLLAHRVMYEMFAGPIPEGLQLDHLCRVRHCLNVAHMEPVTQRENVLRGEGPSAVNARKTHCSAGHPYDEANTFDRSKSPKGKSGRGCRTCRRQWSRDYYRLYRGVRKADRT